MRSSFTLIELLVVIAILAVLATAVVLVLNPSQLLAQGRDSTRLSDLSALNSALSLFQVDAYTQSLGTPNTVYISVPDNASSSCGSLGLPTPPPGWAYHCVPASSSTKVDGTGWIPVNLTLLSSGSPLSKLPIDPTNTTSSGLYYTYVSGGSYALSSALESQKYLVSTASQDQGYDPGRYEIGSDLSLIAKSEGLVGWWPLDGDASDRSGNNNSGTWYGTSTTRYASGKVGQAGQFNGVSDYIDVGNAASVNINGPFTVGAWVNFPDYTHAGGFVSKCSGYGTAMSYTLRLSNDAHVFLQSSNGTVFSPYNTYNASANNNNAWLYFVGVFDGTKSYLYLNGSLVNTQTGFPVPQIISGDLLIGRVYTGDTTSWFSGMIDDARIYNRALSAAEIQAIYNAQK